MIQTFSVKMLWFKVIVYCLCFNKFAISAEEQCRQGVNCLLPDCFCSRLEHPMDRNDIPQMVYFGFDDALNTESIQHYDFLFRRNQTNPNGCPISASLYISHKNTNYDIAKMYYERGFELAVHSVSHTEIDTYTKVLKEARDQRNNIANLAGVPIDEIVGWRSPNLVTAGDGQAAALQSLGYTYDISWSHEKLRVTDTNVWPFTLDFGCQLSMKCPKEKHNGFWVIPINSVVWKKWECVYTDGCYERPKSTEEAYNFIMDNFNRYYQGNRAPFGIHMHMAWFLHPYTKAGMDRAIHDMLRYEDVYIVTAKQVLEWMRQPTRISDIKHFKYWDCKGKSDVRDVSLPDANTDDRGVSDNLSPEINFKDLEVNARSSQENDMKDLDVNDSPLKEINVKDLKDLDENARSSPENNRKDLDVNDSPSKEINLKDLDENARSSPENNKKDLDINYSPAKEINLKGLDENARSSPENNRKDLDVNDSPSKEINLKDLDVNARSSPENNMKDLDVNDSLSSNDNTGMQYSPNRNGEREHLSPVLLLGAVLTCLSVGIVYWLIVKRGKNYTPLRSNLLAEEYSDCTL
ncbi:uncharacterized protein LOC117332082 [Pecten maximus]|uniref:uncharacterized protein LOC117332082 n=1 Tax=Pecten maximus TaxID=6579 RepID=UPI00145842D1|nr:uncharacterized protein LOC117332082 [Pecten maximus]